MPKTIDIIEGKFASGRENNPPIAFLRKVVAEQKQGYVVVQPGCDLNIVDTINVDGTNLIKKIECRVPKCNSTYCVFNQ